MNPSDQMLAQVSDAFPIKFDFYHLGPVELQHQVSEFSEFDFGVAFQIRGDLSAWLMLLFAKDLDVSTYSELGNILASKIATHLQNQTGLGVFISPPYVLENSQIEKIMSNSTPVLRRTYAHSSNGTVIPIEAWILPTTEEGLGNA